MEDAGSLAVRKAHRPPVEPGGHAAEHHLAHLRLLSAASARILTCEDPDDAIRELFPLIRDSLGVGGYFLYRFDGELLRLVSYHGAGDVSPTSFHTLVPGESACGFVFHSQQPLTLDAVQASTDPRTELLRAAGVTAYACFPLTVDGQLFGTLSFVKHDADRFSTEEGAILQAIGDQLATALKRRQAETARLESETRFRTLVRNLPDYAVFMLDPRGFITASWEGAKQVTGYSPGELVGQHVSIFFSETDRAAGEVEDTLAEASEVGRAEREGWRLRKSGERVWVNAIITAIRDEDGELTGFTKISRDLTPQKRMQDALVESEERFRLLVEGARDYAMLLLDPDRRIVGWNAGARRLLGYDEQEAIGRSGDIIFTPEDRAGQQPQKEVDDAVTHGRAVDERWHVRKDGSRFWGSGVTRPLAGRRDASRGFVKVLRDETDRKLSEDALRAAFEQARSANRMKDEFLATLSHELRTPLATARIWHTVLQRKAGDSPHLAEPLRALEQSLQAQGRLIEDLLDTSQIIAGKLRLETQPVDLPPLVQEVVQAMSPEAQAKGVAMEVERLDPDATVAGDPDRLRQVLSNLLQNAVKFTPSGGRITLRLERHAREVELQVHDTGIGMPTEFLPQAFEPFRQADSTSTRQHGGLGLGLAICRQLIEQHGGRIHAESAGSGQGATFTIHLPRTDLTPPREPKPAHDNAVPDRRLAGTRLLVVEDDEATRVALERLLREEGAEIAVAATTSEALASLAQSRPDVLLSDIGMPGEDGYSLIRRVRADETEHARDPLPAIAMTAFARPEDRALALQAGFNLHLKKPLEPGQLVAVIHTLVRSG